MDVDMVAAEVRLSEDAKVISKAYKAILEIPNVYRDMLGWSDRSDSCMRGQLAFYTVLIPYSDSSIHHPEAVSDLLPSAPHSARLKLSVWGKEQAQRPGGWAILRLLL